MEMDMDVHAGTRLFVCLLLCVLAERELLEGC